MQNKQPDDISLGKYRVRSNINSAGSNGPNSAQNKVSASLPQKDSERDNHASLECDVPEMKKVDLISGKESVQIKVVNGRGKANRRKSKASKTALLLKQTNSKNKHQQQISNSQIKKTIKGVFKLSTSKIINQRKGLSRNKPRLTKNSGYITCLVCNQTKFYSHVQRRYGIFSCEPCFKFFSRFVKEPKQFYCFNKGKCLIMVDCDHSNEEEENKTISPNCTGSRCKACWLKLCFDKFKINSDTKQSLVDKYYPLMQTVQNKEEKSCGKKSKYSKLICNNNNNSDSSINDNPKDVILVDNFTMERLTVEVEDKGGKQSNKKWTPATSCSPTPLRLPPPPPSIAAPLPSIIPTPTTSTTSSIQPNTCTNASAGNKQPTIGNDGIVLSRKCMINNNRSSKKSKARNNKTCDTKKNKRTEVKSDITNHQSACNLQTNCTSENSFHTKPMLTINSHSTNLTSYNTASSKCSVSSVQNHQITTNPPPDLMLANSHVSSDNSYQSCQLPNFTNSFFSNNENNCKPSESIVNLSSYPNVSGNKLQVEYKVKNDASNHCCVTSDNTACEMTLQNRSVLTTTNTQQTPKPLQKCPPIDKSTSAKVQSANGKKSRCKECDGCKAQDCGQCTYCLDKKKFGGQNVIKQACKFRVCDRFKNSQKVNHINEVNCLSSAQIIKAAASNSSSSQSSNSSVKSLSSNIQSPNFFPTPPPHSNSQHNSPNPTGHNGSHTAQPSTCTPPKRTSAQMTTNFTNTTNHLSSLPTPTSSPISQASITNYSPNPPNQPNLPNPSMPLNPPNVCSYNYNYNMPVTKTEGFASNCSTGNNYHNFAPNYNMNQPYSTPNGTSNYYYPTNSHFNINSKVAPCPVKDQSTIDLAYTCPYPEQYHMAPSYKSNGIYFSSDYSSQYYSRNNWQQSTYQYPNMNYESTDMTNQLYNPHAHFTSTPSYNYDNYY